MKNGIKFQKFIAIIFYLWYIKSAINIYIIAFNMILSKFYY